MNTRSRAAAKTVFVIRHGQAEHNVNEKALEKRDTELTATGQAQAAALRSRVAALQPEIIFTSPILRALQTTAAMLHTGARVPVVVVPDSRERVSHSAHLCELPVRTELQSRFAAFDWAMVNAAVDQEASGDESSWEHLLMATDLAGGRAIDERTKRLSAWIEARPEASICLVSHGAFLMRLTEDDYMDNCELRTYSLSRGRWSRE